MARISILLKDLLDGGYNLGMSTYPIFDESHRVPLNSLIIGHYLYHEIGFETEGLFKDRLNQKLAEIMPRYNVLFEAQAGIMPWYGYWKNTRIDESGNTATNQNSSQDGTENSNQNGTATSTNDSTQSGNSQSRQGDTPQTHVQNTEDYLSGFAEGDTSGEAHAESDSTSTGASNTSTHATAHANSTGNQNLIHSEKTDGSNVSAAAMMAELNALWFNIDQLIINELAPLFSGIWDIGIRGSW